MAGDGEWFFYDVYRATPFTEEDLAAIEKKMGEVVARDERFVREREAREVALSEYAEDGEFMKVHFIEKFTKPGEEISLYKNGNFTWTSAADHMCRQHRSREGVQGDQSVAGAYWLGDEKNQQLQRIYGTAFFSMARIWTRISSGWKRSRRATIACSASSWICFQYKRWPARG